MTVGVASAANFIATPEGPAAATKSALQVDSNKLQANPTDFLAALQAGGDYLRMAQADITDDNAGNGTDPGDVDPDDGGWMWVMGAGVYTHDGSASPTNIQGLTALGLYHAYLATGDPLMFIAMEDAATGMLAQPPPAVDSGPDMEFLLRLATLPGVSPANKTLYEAGAKDIFDYRITSYGGSATLLAEAIRDLRFGQGYDNGLIPWDISPWAVGAAMLDNVFGGYATAATDIVGVMFDDAYNGAPGYFMPEELQNQGWDWGISSYWYYNLGVCGLIRAFDATGLHSDKIPNLQALLLAGQYPDGAFSDQWGADPNQNDRSSQATANACITIVNNLPVVHDTQNALYRGAWWLSYYQDTSGAWLYSNLTHVPQVGGEALAGLAGAASLPVGADISTTFDPVDDPSMCGTKTLIVDYAPNVGTPGLRGYEVTFRVNGPVNAIDWLNDIDDAGDLGAVGAHQFYVLDNGDDTFTVVDALLGTTPGLLAAGDLFEVTVTSDGVDGDVDLEILSYKLRDPVNAEFYALTWGAGWTFDCTAPVAVTDITATTANESITVDWTMVDESDVDHYMVFRSLWYDGDNAYDSAYPEYDDLTNDMLPTREATYAATLASGEWTLLTPLGTELPAGTTTFVDAIVPRGVYYYEVFVVDVAGNISDPALSIDRAMNYWLGDVFVPFDGLVNGSDITTLGATFGFGDGDFDYNNEADVGPTDDMSGFGFPTTDSVVDFEDLMVFALNYGNVSKMLPAGSSLPVLTWIRAETGAWELTLTEPCANLKGVHLTAALPVGVSCRVEAGELAGMQTLPVFLQNIDRRGLDANLALMGEDAGIVGEGVLLRVYVDDSVDLSGVNIKVRGMDNSELDANTGTAMPTAFVLSQNHPNPFNPKTTISFSLPTERQVRLNVYALDGSLVRTLLSENMNIGTHHVEWDGRDEGGQMAATGAYFFRLEAGPDSQVRKMMLMK